METPEVRYPEKILRSRSHLGTISDVDCEGKTLEVIFEVKRGGTKGREQGEGLVLIAHDPDPKRADARGNELEFELQTTITKSDISVALHAFKEHLNTAIRESADGRAETDVTEEFDFVISKDVTIRVERSNRLADHTTSIIVTGPGGDTVDISIGRYHELNAVMENFPE